MVFRSTPTASISGFSTVPCTRTVVPGVVYRVWCTRWGGAGVVVPGVRGWCARVVRTLVVPCGTGPGPCFPTVWLCFPTVWQCFPTVWLFWQYFPLFGCTSRCMATVSRCRATESPLVVPLSPHWWCQGVPIGGPERPWWCQGRLSGWRFARSWESCSLRLWIRS